jgi:hypothetical protein
MLTTIGVIFFAIFQSEATRVLFFGEEQITRSLCGILLAAACYSVVRILWYGSLCSGILSAPICFHYSKVSYLTRLEYGLGNKVKSKRWNEFIYLLSHGASEKPFYQKWAFWFFFAFSGNFGFFWGLWGSYVSYPYRPPELRSAVPISFAFSLSFLLLGGVVLLYLVHRIWKYADDQSREHREHFNEDERARLQSSCLNRASP